MSVTADLICPQFFVCLPKPVSRCDGRTNTSTEVEPSAKHASVFVAKYDVQG